MNNTIEIKNWKTGDIIFTYICEDNTYKKTVEKAIRQGVNLSYANLKNTNLKFANLSYTNISFTYYFAFANLNGTNLTNANLTNVDLVFTDLSTAILDNVKGLNGQCPKEGSFIGWKKCCYFTPYFNYDPYIVKLEIPADAKRSLCTSIKCKCDKAKVIEIQNLDGTKADIDEVQLRYKPNFKYKVGEIIEVSDFDEIYQKKYASVIYFFMNRGNAIIFN